MRKYLFAAALVCGVSAAMAQNSECARQYSIYKEYMKVGSYDLAVEPYWDVVGQCPDFSRKLYDDGVRIYYELIMKVADSVSVNHYLDTIRNLYERKADALGLDRLDAGNAFLQRCFVLAGSGKISAYRLFGEVLPFVELMASDTENSAGQAIRKTVTAGSAKYRSEFNRLVVSIYRMPETVVDLERLLMIMDILGTCHNDLYISAMEQIQELWQSYNYAARLGVLCMDMGYRARARKYLHDAVVLARKWENEEMVSSDPPSGGLGYLTIASIYLDYAAVFGLDAFGTSEVYWVAADYAAKAVSSSNGDPGIADKAGKIISQCKARFPKKDEAFMHSVKPGDRISLQLFGTETTTARF